VPRRARTVGEHGPERPLPNAPAPAASFCTGSWNHIEKFVAKPYHITDTGGVLSFFLQPHPDSKLPPVPLETATDSPQKR